MGTAIEWTDTVWNPVTGCNKVSEGCRNCYAFTLHDVRHKAFTEGKKLPRQYAKPFSEIQLFPGRLLEPLRWKKPRRVFVNSMSDLFHENVPFEFIEKVFAIMEEAYWHTFQVLTKRPERMLEFMTWYLNRCSDEGVGYRHESPKNVWLGVSVENQRAADERIPLLLQTPAAVRFLSCEPLLGPLDLREWLHVHNRMCYDDPGPGHGSPFLVCDEVNRIDWIIVGGESGPNARPMHPDWVRSLRDQCQAACVPFFFKQHGEWIEFQEATNPGRVPHSTLVKAAFHRFEDGTEMLRVGNKHAGRLLDGREWNEIPNVI